MACSNLPPRTLSERTDADFSLHHKDHKNRRENRDEAEHGKNGNFGAADENPDNQRRVEQKGLAGKKSDRAEKRPRAVAAALGKTPVVSRIR